MTSWIFFRSPRSCSTRSRMSGMVWFSRRFRAIRPCVYVLAYVFRAMDGNPRVSRGSPQGEGRPLAVHHLAGVPVDEDEHRLALVGVLHEPDGGVQQLAVVRRRVDLDRLERVDALLRLLLDELVRERLRLRLRLRLADVSALDVHAAGRALVEVRLVLQLELEAVVRLVLRVPADRDDRDVVLHLDPVPDADDLRLRRPRVDVAPLVRGRG